MLLAFRAATFLVVVLSIWWYVVAPGWEPAVAAATAVAAFLGSFLGKARAGRTGGQIQDVGAGAIGVQAGRDAHVDNVRR